MAITRFTVDDNVIDTRMNQMVDEVDSAIGQKANSVNAELTGTARLNGKEIATTESYKLQASDMLNGWTFGTDENDLPIIIKSGKIIIINALLKAGVVSSNTPIFSIPERFLPSVTIRNNFYKTASLNYAEFTIVQGGLRIYNANLATNDIVKISIQYSIA